MEEKIWHKAYAPGVSKQIEIERITLPRILSRNSRKYPGRPAMLFMGKKITYGELNQQANQFAAALHGIGVRPGDKVGLLLPNIPQIVIGYYGIWRLGAIPVPGNPLYTDRELEHQFNTAKVTTVVALDRLAPRMLALKEKTLVENVISCHIGDYLPFPAKILFPYVKKEMYQAFEPAKGHYDWAGMLKNVPDRPPSSPLDWDDTAVIPFTGGTTGLSKGVVLTHGNISTMVQLLQSWFFDTRETKERIMALFPFFHLAGFTAVMNLAVQNGWAMIMAPRPDPETIVDLMLKYKPTVFPAVPTVYIGMLKHPRFKKADLSFIKGFFSGAAPLPQEVINELKAATGSTIVEAFGMTESSAIVTVTPWRGQLKPGSVGVPLPNTEVRIMDLESGTREMPIGREGEIVFRGPQMCRGYYQMPDETASAIRDGWFYTGDIGRMDEDGYLYIVDRKKDMIIAGGFNIYPRDIDEVLYEHPKVLEACALGIADPYRGETVKAFVVAHPGETLTAGELDEFCRERLAAYKVPKAYIFMDELPKSAIGKILRRELRALEEKKQEEASLDETPMDETPMDETPMDETPMDETPMEETLEAETPMEETLEAETLEADAKPEDTGTGEPE